MFGRYCKEVVFQRLFQTRSKIDKSLSSKTAKTGFYEKFVIVTNNITSQILHSGSFFYRMRNGSSSLSFSNPYKKVQHSKIQVYLATSITFRRSPIFFFSKFRHQYYILTVLYKNKNLRLSITAVRTN